MLESNSLLGFQPFKTIEVNQDLLASFYLIVEIIEMSYWMTDLQIDSRQI